MQYTLKRYRNAKHVRIRVHGDEVIVTAPKRLSKRWIDAFVEDRAEWVRGEQTRRMGAGDLVATSKDHYKKHKAEALRCAENLVQEWSIRMNAHPNKVSVRCVRSRWGSCSREGNLSFSYKILFLPRELKDYLVVHELAHLTEMNHSQAFWSLVAQYIDEPKKMQRALRSLC